MQIQSMKQRHIRIVIWKKKYTTTANQVLTFVAKSNFNQSKISQFFASKPIYTI